MRYFVPSPRWTNLLVLLGCAAFGYAIYLRYLVIEVPQLEAVCAAGVVRPVCSLRQLAIELSEVQLFGGLALLAALAHFWRPKILVFAVSSIAAVFGLVLYNAGIAALAVGLLVMAFARPALSSTPTRAPARPLRTTTPASSRPSP